MTNTEAPESFQIPIEAAEAYEAAFVPAFFAQWAPILCDAGGRHCWPADPRRGLRHRRSSPAPRQTVSERPTWSASISTKRC